MIKSVLTRSFFYVNVGKVGLNDVIKTCYSKSRPYPPLNEDEIVETFSNGSGPGGQKLNKTHNKCQLKHIPTGIIVSSHHTRSLEENRKIARELMQERLDLHYNKDASLVRIEEREKARAREEKRKRSVENLKKKREFKEREL